MTDAARRLCERLGIKTPLICGAMYPCSNPELVAAASQAGGIGIIQPLSLTYVHGYEFRAGLQKIRSLTDKPVGLNLLIEASSKIYLDRMRNFLDAALNEGVRFFVTALGNPDWVTAKVHAKGGLVFHDVTERKWAEKALKSGVDGLICVNKLAGGHAGTLSPEDLYSQLKDLDVPLICAGGVGSPARFKEMLDLGYAGVQMGTRFIATTECTAPEAYKKAILNAHADDVVLSERITGVPVAIIRSPETDRVGYKASGILKWMLKHPKLKHWARMYFSLKSFRDFKRAVTGPDSYKNIWQAGKSVEDVKDVKTTHAIYEEFSAGL